MISVKRILLVVSTCVLLTACAGPKPAIQHRLSMDMLQNSPPEVRGPVADAHNSHYLAKVELAHLEFQLEDIEFELRMAKTEKKMAKQSMEMEKIKSERNNRSYKTKLMDVAKAAMFGHDSRADAMDDKLRYLKSQRKYLRKGVLHARAKINHTEARFELAKAKLANQRKTVPKGFTLAKFVSQEKRTAKVAGKKAQKVKSAKSEAQGKQRIWNKANKSGKTGLPAAK